MCELPLNIVLADDDTDDCIFFKEALDELPIATGLKTVNNGEQLMELLANEAFLLPDVLFLDVNMPRKNGLECLLEIKLNLRLKHLPLIMFSTSLDPEAVNFLYSSGAQYFILKPPDFSELKKVIQQTLTLVAQGNILQPARENFALPSQSRLIMQNY